MGFLDKLFGRSVPKTPAPPPANIASRPSSRDINEDETLKEASWEQSGGVPQELAASEVLELYRSADPPVFLDVREQQELENFGRIPGSIHIPMGEVETRHHELNPGKAVVVYCASGMRSMDVGAFLIEKGFRDVSNLNGGLNNWKGPVEKP